MTSAITAAELPQRFIDAEKGDVQSALSRYEKTMKWRTDNDVESILDNPHQHFNFIKSHTLQYYHKRTKQGHPIYIEVPKHSDIPKLKVKGIAIPQLLYHYTFITEFVWKRLEPNDTGKFFSIIDLVDVGISDCVGNIMAYLKAINAVSQEHYPERSFMMIIVNAPWGFSTIWNLIKRFLDPEYAKQIQIFSSISKAKSELLKHIASENLPVRYGGSCSCQPIMENGKSEDDPKSQIHGGCFYYSPDELQMRQLVRDVNKKWTDNPENKSRELRDFITMGSNI